MTSQNESHSFHIPSNDELPHKRRTSRFPWQSASCAPMLSSDIRIRTSNQQRDAFGVIECKRVIAITEPGKERFIYD